MDGALVGIRSCKSRFQACFTIFLQTRAKTLDKCLLSMIYSLLRRCGGYEISRPTREGEVRVGKED